LDQLDHQPKSLIHAYLAKEACTFCQPVPLKKLYHFLTILQYIMAVSFLRYLASSTLLQPFHHFWSDIFLKIIS
jgi:hypothetical protein